ncbi:OadG family protein [Rheinheimera sp.]|jgi:oxaloacetate decarboxylase gamma subunit|uniref:OadG family protein n=1 Tax=Rheinheimera sp. TaxID=1869214 RepID=UPI00263A2C90|nr:OadG family transporter subunit [Rheinheimera sp.]MCA1930056.1 OadG family protein [Rheinheimera sp.]
MDAEQQVGALLLDAAILMLVGMGVVFGFLMLLVWAVQVMSRLVRPTAVPVTSPVASSQPEGISPAVVAAISSAIEHHHKQHKG